MHKNTRSFRDGLVHELNAGFKMWEEILFHRIVDRHNFVLETVLKLRFDMFSTSQDMRNLMSLQLLTIEGGTHGPNVELGHNFNRF